jgi:hypothetical protein
MKHQTRFMLYALFAGLALASPAHEAQALMITPEGPGVRFSSIINEPSVVETFNGSNDTCQPSSNAIFSQVPSRLLTTANTPGVTLNPTRTCYISLRRNQAFSITLPSTVPSLSILQQFGFFWGTVDPRNTVHFFLDDIAIATITGENILRETRIPNAFFNFILPPSEGFNRIEFANNEDGATFEIDNLTVGFTTNMPPLPLVGRVIVPSVPIYVPGPTAPDFPLPPRFLPLSANPGLSPFNIENAQAVSEPASLALFGAGLGLLGLMASRRNRIKAA